MRKDRFRVSRPKLPDSLGRFPLDFSTKKQRPSVRHIRKRREKRLNCRRTRTIAAMPKEPPPKEEVVAAGAQQMAILGDDFSSPTPQSDLVTLIEGFAFFNEICVYYWCP